jgi:gliding motility-associated-like protein
LLDNLPPGAYNFIITDVNNCTLPININLTQPLAITVSGLTTYAIYCGEEVQMGIDVLGGSTPYSYDWNFEHSLDCATCEDPLAKPTESTTFTVKVTDNNGCFEFYSVTIAVDCNVYVPNTFTPNMDEINPIFYAYVGAYQSFSMRIYNRWGQEVFESTDKASGWDGTYQSNPVPEDVYTYDLYVVMATGKEISMRGMVNVLR